MTPDAIQEIVAINGGRLVGKTRLQKTMYLLETCGLGYGFDFAYHYYGPYSEDVAAAALDASALGLIAARPEPGSGGALVYSTDAEQRPLSEGDGAEINRRRRHLLSKLSAYDTTTLELAATAEFLRRNGFKSDLWTETRRRKSVKATDERIGLAKELLQSFQH